jgi:hypothetical protein
MNLDIYISSNEEAMLKSIGPFRIASSDKSFSGPGFPQKREVGISNIFGEIKIYGEQIIM